MSTGFALWRRNSRDFDWGRLVLDQDGILTLETVSGADSVALDADAAPYVDAYVREGWLCALGGADRRLIVGTADPARLAITAELVRIGKTDHGFDFETHSVRFRDRPGREQCLLAWELGVALVDPTVGVVWSYEHHDVNQRVLRITHDSVDLRSTHTEITIALNDGSATVRQFRKPVAGDDGEALAAWMRGIGR